MKNLNNSYPKESYLGIEIKQDSKVPVGEPESVIEERRLLCERVKEKFKIKEQQKKKK